MTSSDGSPFAAEVLAALEAEAPGDPAIGERIRLDRGSALRHLGLRTPVRRARVQAGFSFSVREPVERIAAWDEIWQTSDCADVLFAALDDYRERLPRDPDPTFWPVASRWIDRVDNWAHADDLARVYSHALAADPDGVAPTLRAWNESSSVWHRRISLVSNIHYSGPHAVFAGPDVVLPLIDRCLDDDRDEVQKAVGWVLREMARQHHHEIVEFVDAHRDHLSRVALRRATERFDPELRRRLRR